MKKTLLTSLFCFLSLSVVYSQTCTAPGQITATDTSICEFDTITLTYPSLIDSAILNSPPVNNNGQDGNMFDVFATNTIRIKYFEGNIANTPNPTTQYYIYYKVGTHVGFESNPAAWTLAAGPITITPNAPNTYTTIPYNVNITIPAGQTYAFYLTNTSAATNNNRYHNGTATGTILASNADLTLFEGTGGAYPFGTFFNARPWEGNIVYDYPTTFLWSTGDTLSSINVNPASTTTYYCTASIPSCTVMDSIVIEAHPLPVVNLGIDTTICTGQSINIDAGNPGSYFLWNNGDTTQLITVDTAGIQMVTVTDVYGCSGEDSIEIFLNPLPAVGYSVLPNDTLCEGDSVTLNGTGAVSYSWTGGITDGVPFAPSFSGAYDVVGTDANGCTNTATASITVHTLPVISLGADIVQPNPPATIDAGSGFSTYLWNTAETTQSISVNANGTYFVTVSNAEGCFNSDTIQVIFTAGISNANGSESSIEVYPVPSDGILNLQIKNADATSLQFSITDLKGNLIRIFNEINVSGLYQDVINITELESGMYILNIHANGSTSSIRFIRK